MVDVSYPLVSPLKLRFQQYTCKGVHYHEISLLVYGIQVRMIELYLYLLKVHWSLRR